MSGGQEDEGQEKSSEPTPERLRKAREDGDVAKSNDVSVAASYIGLLLTLSISAAGIAKGFGEALYGFIAMPELFSERIHGGGATIHIKSMVSEALWALAPLFFIPMGCVIIALYGQQAVVFAPKKLELKLSRLSMISNAKQKFGITGIVEFLKSFVKLIAISIAMFFIVYFAIDRYIEMPMAPGTALPFYLRDEAMRLLMVTTVIVGTIACFDYFWNVFDHSRKLRMSFQEIKEETKESEGDPHMKGTRKQRAREIAMNQMLVDVPKADVIIVNPTHYAVALQWSRSAGSAPVCVAKGVDEIAAKIREIADENSIPIFSDPPTARLIHATVDIGAEIEPDQYRAVAVAIRFADEMQAKARDNPGYRPGGDGP